jgi:diadenosine tetraphosphate (Ap4A) HIT family hydrolase
MTDNTSWQSDRLGAALRGGNPMFVARMGSGLVFLHDAQFLPGWCVLLAQPAVARLEDLEDAPRNRFLADMGGLGRAVAAALQPRRVNYAIYGNTLPLLHAHIIPRYDWEPADRVTQPVWTYPPAQWRDMPLDYDPADHAATRDAVAAALRAMAHA